MTGPVLWISERYPPAKGGMAVSCARQVRGLRKRGLTVDVLSFTGNTLEPVTQAADGGVNIAVRKGDAPEIAPNLAWTAVRERHLRKRYECVVGFGASRAGYIAATFAAWLGAPCVTLVRGNDLDRDWFLPRRGAWVREAFARSAAIGAVSREKVERIAGLYPDRPVEWTPNAVDWRRWELLPGDEARRDQIRGLLAGRRIFGLFGELKFKKRIPMWLEAVRDAGLLRSIGLLVVGTLDADTSRILDDAAIAPQSVRLPFCAADELAGLYAACDFVAIPSAFEGMPNVLLEAMACGAIPVVSDAGAMADVVTDGETGFVFAAENRRAAGEATRRAVGMEDGERAAMSERARTLVRERFTLENEAATLLGLLRTACERWRG